MFLAVQGLRLGKCYVCGGPATLQRCKGCRGAAILGTPLSERCILRPSAKATWKALSSGLEVPLGILQNSATQSVLRSGVRVKFSYSHKG